MMNKNNMDFMTLELEDLARVTGGWNNPAYMDEDTEPKMRVPR